MLKQQLQLKLAQKLSPQQIQLMKLIQLPTLDFEQRLQNELEENPALETGKEQTSQEDSFDQEYEDNTEVIEIQDIDIDAYLSDDEIPAYRLNTNNYSSDEDEKITPITGGVSFHESLKQQIGSLILSEEEQLLALFIVGSLDESGYLRRSLEDLMDDLAFTQGIVVEIDTLEKVLKKVQDIDPPGVGARNLQECLSIQLERKETSVAVLMARQIINEGFEFFSKKHYKKMQDKFDVDEILLKKGLDEIEKLNPKPGGAMSGIFQNTHIVPDFILTIENGEIQVNINRRNAPELHVSSGYQEMLRGYKEASKKSKVSVMQFSLSNKNWMLLSGLSMQYSNADKPFN